MSAAPALRCMMKIRTCGLFWYKAVVTLSHPETKTHGPASQGQLTIARPKAFGGVLKIPLGQGNHVHTTIFRREDQQRRLQFSVCYGVWRRCVTVRAATDALYQAWWASLETAYLSLELNQISRALATNFGVLPEPEQESTSDLEEFGVLGNGMPLLEDVRPASTSEADERESWKSSESPDELIVIASATDCTTENDSDELASKSAIGCLAAASGQPSDNLEADKEECCHKIICGEPGESKPRTRSSDARCINGALIESNVLGCIPYEVHELIDRNASRSGSSSSTDSSLDSNVLDLLPKHIYDMLEDCGSVCSHTDDALVSESCGSSSDWLNFHDSRFSLLRDSDNLCDHASPVDINNYSSGWRTDVHPEDGPAEGITLDGVLLTTEAERVTTTRGVFALPFRTTSTPFERLRLRQHRRAAVNCANAANSASSLTRRNHSPPEERGALPINSNTPDKTNDVDANGGDHPVWPKEISNFRSCPTADEVHTRCRQPPKLFVGRINKAHVEEVEQFVLRRVPDVAHASKKSIVIERVTRAWTDVARFAFRPHAVTDHVAKKHHHQ